MSNDYDIVRIYKDMEQEIVSSMQRNLSGHMREEKAVGFDYPQWQAEKLRSLRQYQIENAKIINSYTEGLPTKVKAILQDELKQGSLQEIEKFKEALAAGYKSATVMNESFFRINARKVNALINSVNNDFKKANQACLRYADDAYRKAIFKSEMYVANGVFTEKKAIEKAIEDFEKQGLHCIEYADGSRRDIADYADMAIKTASQRAYLMGEGEMRKKIGKTLIKISKHGGTCPLCAKWEGKVLIDDVYSNGTAEDGPYPLLSEAMAAGLYHPRCRHGCNTYYPEIEDIWDDEDTFESENSQEKHYSKSSEFSVPKDMTTTREFRQKFDSMASNKEMQREYYSVAKKMLNHRSGTNGEDIYLYNTRTKKWVSSTNGVNASMPEYNDEIINAIKNANKDELVAFHNHPLGTPPSISDLNASLKNGYLEGYTIGHNGTIYRYTPPNAIIDEYIYELRVANYIEKGYNTNEAKTKALQYLQKFYNFKFNEVI